MSDREAAQGEGAGAAASIVRHGYLSITDITDRGMIDLQIAEPETALVEVVSEALGAVLPADAHHSSSNGSLTILGRGPGHWVISCPASETARWTGRLETAIAGNLAMVTSIGEGYSILRLRGDAAGGALLRGADIDLYGREGNQGAVSHTRLAGAEIMIHAIDAGRRGFDLYVPRSLSGHVARWLEDTARNSAIVTPFAAASPTAQPAQPSRT
ncbi:MAG: hypothetical protein KDJ46_05860 [Rhodobiaceae bacterium]|nr:hypothetical protein [Rhodobiaceae bacterium]